MRLLATRSFVFVVLANLLLMDVARVQTQEVASPSFTAERPGTSSEIPLSTEAGVILAHITTQPDRKTLNFLVDTGSEITVQDGTAKSVSRSHVNRRFFR
jgi:hypothetical protein